MSRFTRTAAAVSTAVVTAGLLAGCAAGEEKAVPELPKRICWGGAFAGSDVTPLLPPGDKAEFSPLAGRSFVLNGDVDSAICTLYVDGNTKFQASADLEKFEESIEWSSWDSADPKPLDVGEKGIIFDRGALAYFTCEPAKNPNSPGKYIELEITADDAPDKSKLQAALPALMKEFMAFAQRELKCPGSAAGGA
ncbi:hypothetical protein [Streptomyces roseolus]|uniref:hypothetical protein n=1 Tax=Streptomyces roseolus TaxID=67358 RepID=UPI00167A67D0|nr:hypothetical protein [Streptomyces roseolus]GGR32226.1 hypothetical protein GCM10010282_25790 [Streptomyces roseolus]